MPTRDLNRAYHLLRRPIPPPAQPIAKPQDSWQQLKPGQRLRSLTPMVIGIIVVPTGTDWIVTNVNSLGATLNTIGTPTEVKFRLTQTDWKSMFTRVRGVRSKTPKTITATKRRKPTCSTSTATPA